MEEKKRRRRKHYAVWSSKKKQRGTESKVRDVSGKDAETEEKKGAEIIMNTIKTFAHGVADSIKEYLPKEYEDYQISVE